MDNKEFFAAFDDLCKEKGIGREEFIETLKNALNSAYKKQYDDGSEVFVDIDPEKGIFECNAVQKVVAEVTDRDREISVEEAQAINPEYREGDEIVRTFVPQDFGRIAAQTARQVILQKLREKERDNTFSAISDKEGELMEATVRKIDDKNVYVDFADRKIEGVMLPQDQSPTEKYEPNDVIKVFVKRVKSGGRNSQVLVSRTAPGEKAVRTAGAGNRAGACGNQIRFPRGRAQNEDGDLLFRFPRGRGGRVRRQQGQPRERRRERTGRRENRYYSLERKSA